VAHVKRGGDFAGHTRGHSTATDGDFYMAMEWTPRSDQVHDLGRFKTVWHGALAWGSRRVVLGQCRRWGPLCWRW